MSSSLFQAQGGILELPVWREDTEEDERHEPTCPPESGSRGALGWRWGLLGVSTDNTVTAASLPGLPL